MSREFHDWLTERLAEVAREYGPDGLCVWVSVQERHYKQLFGMDKPEKIEFPKDPRWGTFTVYPETDYRHADHMYIHLSSRQTGVTKITKTFVIPPEVFRPRNSRVIDWVRKTLQELNFADTRDVRVLMHADTAASIFHVTEVCFRMYDDEVYGPVYVDVSKNVDRGDIMLIVPYKDGKYTFIRGMSIPENLL